RLSTQSDASWWDLDFPPQHPVQMLADSRKAQDAFSKLIETAFGEQISINRYDAGQIRLKVGSVGLPDEPPPPSDELRAAYQKLPLVAEQGDGFRAFVHVLLKTLVRPTPIVLVDEPEAFLHPPQARLLGRYLAELTPAPCQIFV